MMKGKSIIEVLLVFILSYLFGWLFLTDMVRSEIEVLGWSYISDILLILIPVIILLLTKRNFEHYGFTLKRWKHNLSVGLTCYLIRLIPFSFLFASVQFSHKLYRNNWWAGFSRWRNSCYFSDPSYAS